MNAGRALTRCERDGQKRQRVRPTSISHEAEPRARVTTRRGHEDDNETLTMTADRGGALTGTAPEAP